MFVRMPRAAGLQSGGSMKKSNSVGPQTNKGALVPSSPRRRTLKESHDEDLVLTLGVGAYLGCPVSPLL